MPVRFFTKKELSILLNVSEEIFHTEIKKIIKKDFKADLTLHGFDNPDVLLDETHLMTLADPNNHNNCFATGVSIFDYII